MAARQLTAPAEWPTAAGARLRAGAPPRPSGAPVGLRAIRAPNFTRFSARRPPRLARQRRGSKWGFSKKNCRLNGHKRGTPVWPSLAPIRISAARNKDNPARHMAGRPLALPLERHTNPLAPVRSSANSTPAGRAPKPAEQLDKTQLTPPIGCRHLAAFIVFDLHQFRACPRHSSGDTSFWCWGARD